jgi:hypothetical protein
MKDSIPDQLLTKTDILTICRQMVVNILRTFQQPSFACACHCRNSGYSIRGNPNLQSGVNNVTWMRGRHCHAWIPRFVFIRIVHISSSSADDTSISRQISSHHKYTNWTNWIRANQDIRDRPSIHWGLKFNSVNAPRIPRRNGHNRLRDKTADLVLQLKQWSLCESAVGGRGWR